MKTEKIRSIRHGARQKWLEGGSFWSIFAFQPTIEGTSRLGMIGDSITHHGNYPIYLDVFYHTRFPSHSVDIVNLGISGGDADGAIKRFSWDISTRNIDVATIMMGMNDVGRELYKPGPASRDIDHDRCRRIENYEKNIRTLVHLLIEKHVKPVLITPSIYDDTLQGAEPNLPGVNVALAECAERLKKIAAEYDLPLIDVHSRMTLLNNKIQASAPACTVVGSDRVHPGPSGHLAITYWILQQQQAPRSVSCITIDASEKKLKEKYNCTVSSIDVRPEQIKFTYLAAALPYPFDFEAQTALDWIPFNNDFNQETLQIKGLEEGVYKLEIDGKLVCNYSARELAAGVNLANERNTPQSEQAYNVLNLCISKGRIAQRIRDILMVEFGATAELSRPVSLEQVRPFLAVRLKAAEDKPWFSYIQQTNKEYFTNKPREEELHRELEKLSQQVCEAAIPNPHFISIKKINLHSR